MIKIIGKISEYFDNFDAPDFSVALIDGVVDECNLDDTLLLSDINKVDILSKLSSYPSMCNLLKSSEESVSSKIDRIKNKLNHGFYVFGAHKVGAFFVKQCNAAGLTVNCYLDNDKEKHGTLLNGLMIKPPTAIDLKGQSIVITSGRYSNEIQNQLKSIDCNVYNMHQVQYIFDLKHQAEASFRMFYSDLYKKLNSLLI